MPPPAGSPSFNTLDVTPKASGERVTIEEVGLYTVDGEQITREEFYFNEPLWPVAGQ